MDDKGKKSDLGELQLEIQVKDLQVDVKPENVSNDNPIETLDLGSSDSNEDRASDISKNVIDNNSNDIVNDMQDISDDFQKNDIGNESNDILSSNPNEDLSAGHDVPDKNQSINDNSQENVKNPSSENDNQLKRNNDSNNDSNNESDGKNDGLNNKENNQHKNEGEQKNPSGDSNPNDGLNDKENNQHKNEGEQKNPSSNPNQNDGLNNNGNSLDKQNPNNQPQKNEPKENKAIDDKRNEAKKRNDNLKNKNSNNNKVNNGAKNSPANKGNKNFAKNYAKNYARNKLNNSELGSKIGNAVDKAQKAKKTVKAIKNIKNIKNIVTIGGGLISALPVILGILAGAFLVVVIMAIFSPSGGSGSIIPGYSDYTGGFYCTNITVGDKTYELEEYVARVIAQELGGANTEGLKAQAVLARTFVLNKTKNGKCTIGNSENEQTLKTGDINEKYRTAANATKGEVLTHNGKLTGAYYATFPNGVVGSQDWGEGGCGAITCQDGSCTTKFYKYPSKTAWNITLPEKNKSGNYWNGASLQNQKGHCHGASQLGIMYYDEQGKKYNEILAIFFDSDVKISKLESGSGAGSIAYQGAGSFKKKITYYNQIDYNTTGYCGRTPGSYAYYGCNHNTICTSGCGGTSLAMIASSIKEDPSITPITIMQYVKEKGGCGPGISGSTINGLVEAAKTLGLTAYSTTSSSDVAKKLSTGEYLAIANVGASEFTSQGHYIVLSGYNNGKVYVLDPNGGEKTSMKNSQKLLSKLTSRDRNGWWNESSVFDYVTNGYIIIGKK